ncbi:Hypothetical predicted protein [Mytilus galloprovincialis]|uniref:Uncharacterized protein n=1 Tax=Mytilus galloprovincialis TaxID=29158 RepID=A0A8B6HMT2_MYTGA|nr:Hypothetical predicted protein [Mytilus galloprovincialis]
MSVASRMITIPIVFYIYSKSKIYDGESVNDPLLLHLPGGLLDGTTVQSTANKMLVRFQSDFLGDFPGFDVNYIATITGTYKPSKIVRRALALAYDRENETVVRILAYPIGLIPPALAVP